MKAFRTRDMKSPLVLALISLLAAGCDRPSRSSSALALPFAFVQAFPGGAYERASFAEVFDSGLKGDAMRQVDAKFPCKAATHVWRLEFDHEFGLEDITYYRVRCDEGRDFALGISRDTAAVKPWSDQLYDK